MTRPVRPIALVILTICMVYPGVTMLFQGLYPFVAGAEFNLVGQLGPWVDVARRMGLPPLTPFILKSLVGLAWLAGVPGLWAGDVRAYPLVLLAALGSLLNPIGPSIMAVIALICLLGFRENAEQVPA
jgi:hypothetical protein